MPSHATENRTSSEGLAQTQDFTISDDELKDLIGNDVAEAALKANDSFWKLLTDRGEAFVAPLVAIWLLVFLFIALVTTIRLYGSMGRAAVAVGLAAAVGVTLLVVLVAWALTTAAQQRTRREYGHILGLLKETEHFNSIVENITILDQLKDAGNPVELSDRTRVVQGLTTMREDLVRAFKTERILRENPQFRPEHFEVDLTALSASQLSECSSEYGRLLDEALQIGTSVQKERT